MAAGGYRPPDADGPPTAASAAHAGRHAETPTVTMRIALTHVYAWPEVRRGSERYLHELGAALQAAGHEVAITTTSAAGARRGAERGVPVRYLRRRHLLRRRTGALSDELAFGLQSLAALGASGIDVWHAMGTADAAAASLVATIRDIRSVYTDHGFPYRPSRERRPDRLLHDLVVRRADRYVCVSTAAAATLSDGYGRDAEVLSGGVDLERFVPGARRHPTPVLLFAGDADERRKNLPLLARSVASLRTRRSDIALWVAGPGDQRAAVAGAGLPDDAVRLVGEVRPDDLQPLYQQAWATVLPARAEAFGLVLVESLACGTPIVALDEGGPRDIVRPGIGFLSTEQDDALADACAAGLDLAARPDTTATCRDAAAAWDWRTAIVPKMEQIYGA